MLRLLRALVLVVPGTLVAAPPPTIDPEELKPGQRGEWRTVVRGTTIESFPLEVVGVAPHFAAAGQEVILCRALDPVNIGTGPVGGMSGSPVYFDGRLAGAYAYGFTWPKGEALIGVTPIRDMLELLDLGSAGGSLPPPAPAAGQAAPGQPSLPRAGTDPDAVLAPVPTPLVAGGFSARTLAAHADAFSRLGMRLVAAASGGGAELDEESIVPGAAVSAVLAAGDLSVDATGTVTWRDGDRMLGFGHPFLAIGPAELPMAPASILTIASRVPSSFKLSVSGPIVGTITQDRLNGIAGVVGRMPAMVDVEAEWVPVEGGPRRFAVKLAHHRWVTPALLGMIVTEASWFAQSAAERQTLVLEGEARFAGHDPMPLRAAADGDPATLVVASAVSRAVGSVLEHPEESARLESVRFVLRATPGFTARALDGVALVGNRFRPGDLVTVRVSLAAGDGNGAGEEREAVFAIPANARKGERWTIAVLDAAAATDLVGGPAGAPRSVAGLIARARSTPSPTALHVALLAPRPGVQWEGRHLPDLPPSVAASLGDASTRVVGATLPDAVVELRSLPLGMPYRGTHRISFVIE